MAAEIDSSWCNSNDTDLHLRLQSVLSIRHLLSNLTAAA